MIRCVALASLIDAPKHASIFRKVTVRTGFNIFFIGTIIYYYFNLLLFNREPELQNFGTPWTKMFTSLQMVSRKESRGTLPRMTSSSLAKRLSEGKSIILIIGQFLTKKDLSCSDKSCAYR